MSLNEDYFERKINFDSYYDPPEEQYEEELCEVCGNSVQDCNCDPEEIEAATRKRIDEVNQDDSNEEDVPF